MSTRRIVGVVLLVVGVLLAWRGWEAKQTMGARLGEMMGSSATNAWLMLGAGAVLVIVGAVLAVRS